MNTRSSPSQINTSSGAAGATVALLVFLVLGACAWGGWAYWEHRQAQRDASVVFEMVAPLPQRTWSVEFDKPTVPFDLHVEHAMRQSDGSWRILLSCRFEGEGTLDVVQLNNVRLAESVEECQVFQPTGPVITDSIDLVVQTPPLGEDVDVAHLSYELHLERAQKNLRETSTTTGSLEASLGLQ